MKIGNFIHKEHCRIRYSRHEFEHLCKLLAQVVAEISDVEMPTGNDELPINTMLHFHNLHQLNKRLQKDVLPKQITYTHAEAFSIMLTLGSEMFTDAIQTCAYTQVLIHKTVNTLHRHYISPASFSGKNIYAKQHGTFF